MPDNPTTVPTAGWYTDPSDPTHERWWGGVEWTHDVRPLPAPAPAMPPPAAPQPVFAQQPVYTAPTPAQAPLAAPSQFSAHAAMPAEPVIEAQPSFAPPAAAAAMFPPPQAAQAVFAPPAAVQPAYAPPQAAPAAFAPQQVAPQLAIAPAAPAATPTTPFTQFQGQPVIAKPLSMADVPGGGINPFAAIDAHEASLSGAPFGAPYSAPAPALAASPSGFTGFESYEAFGASVSPAASMNANAGWYDTTGRANRPEPTNVIATVGLILSLIGANVVGVILSAIALRKARGFEDAGDLPVGRKRARWGLGLGIASIIISIAIIAAYVLAAPYLLSLYTQQFGSGVDQTSQDGGITFGTDDSGFFDDGTTTTTDEGTDPAATSYASNGGITDDSYQRAAYEQGVRDEYTEEGYTPFDSITCPDTGSLNAGGIIICEIKSGSSTLVRTAEYYENGGYSISTQTVSQ